MASLNNFLLYISMRPRALSRVFATYFVLAFLSPPFFFLSFLVSLFPAMAFAKLMTFFCKSKFCYSKAKLTCISNTLYF